MNILYPNVYTRMCYCPYPNEWKFVPERDVHLRHLRRAEMYRNVNALVLALITSHRFLLSIEMDRFVTVSKPRTTQKSILAYAVETPRGTFTHRPSPPSKRSLPAEKRRRSPLVQGGLEIPCILTLRGKKLVARAKELLAGKKLIETS